MCIIPLTRKQKNHHDDNQKASDRRMYKNKGKHGSIFSVAMINRFK